MAAKCSISPAIVWNWVIEAIASSEQADLSTLIGLVKLVPTISGDAGKGTREIISLRILESLFDHGNEAAVDPKTPKISFDSSESCEDVLKKILQETPEQMDKLETEKWDVGSFLKHKRSSMPKFLLKKLKEAMIENCNPVLASLKEKSKLVISNESEDIRATDGESPKNPTADKTKFQEKMLQDGNVPQVNMVVKSKDSDNIVRPNNERTDDDDDSERTNIVTRKEAFLTAQCTLNQDSLTMAEWSEMDLCMKCNESGELLVCSSDSCSIRVHKSCVGSAATLEENGDFFCPFCAYSCAISKYQEATRNASLARKNLQSFSSFTVKPTPNKSSTKHSDLEENVDRQPGDNVNCMSNEKDPVLPDTVMPDVNDDDDDDPFLEKTTELSRNPIPEPSTPKQKCKEKESQRSTVTSLTRRLRKRKVKPISPPAPILRRRTLPWAKSEEEALKEGVKRYSSGNNSKIPWKEILDFGCNVFHKGRTTIDLKDKWRNICKGIP